MGTWPDRVTGWGGASRKRIVMARIVKADPDQLMRDTVIKNDIAHGQRLLDFAGIPLLLENFWYHPTNAYRHL